MLCQGILPLDRTRVVGDSATAFFGATIGQPGVVIVSGTGSIVQAQNETGRAVHAGGWGHLLGDEGSAYWIARQAVRAAIAASEGLGPPTDLMATICQWFQVQTLTEIVPKVYSPAFTKEKFAALTQFLGGRLGSEDPVWVEIRRTAGQVLARQASAVIRMAGFATEPVKVYLSGGVLQNDPAVRNALKAHLLELASVHFQEPCLRPILGAGAMALQDFGLELTPELVASLNAQMAARGRPISRA
jgi:N-acetylglucosamine kinase-like BadF-type ATPase